MAHPRFPRGLSTVLCLWLTACSANSDRARLCRSLIPAFAVLALVLMFRPGGLLGVETDRIAQPGRA